MTDHLQELSEAGVSIWLDDLSRERIETGNLADLIKNEHVVGVTTNPSIFAAALSNGERYDDQVRELARRGRRRRRHGLRDHHHRRPQRLRRDEAGLRRHQRRRRPGLHRGRPPASPTTRTQTLASAQALWKEVDRENLFIKIPATTEGAPAITDALGDGISVNVTLIFGLDRYRGVMEAYLAGLEKAAGQRPRPVHDPLGGLVLRQSRRHRDRQPAQQDRRQSDDLLGKAGVANARLAYELYEQTFAGERWEKLRRRGCQHPATAVGLDRRQEPRLQGHDVRRRPRRGEHREHHAGEDPRRGPRPQRDHRRPGPAELRRRPTR